mmetsp:Transcript_7248/g.20684  ORF Transcript_7248/g.20684 Transcript_7248/m.20684 type:complete len:402 (+) Transcript_7248:26-1231(+)
MGPLPLLLLLPFSLPSSLPRAEPAPSLVPARRLGRHASVDGVQRELVQCPTRGCCTPLRPERVKAHLKKCPVLLEQNRLEESGYYIAGVNSGAGEIDQHADLGVPVLTPQLISDLESKIRAAHDERLGLRLFHTAVDRQKVAGSAAMAALKGHERERARHRVQRTSIAEVLAALKVVGKGHCIIEVGAGNGHLSLAIADAVANVSSDALLLVDKGRKPKGKSGHNRLAADPVLRQRFGEFERVQLGLEDVDLTGLRDVLAPKRPTVIVAKHLCGAASDFVLRAIAAAALRPQPPVAVVLGTCCHHKCDWSAFPNRQFLQQTLGIESERDFRILCRLSSRGVVASDFSPRADAGRRAKDLLDEARASFLSAQGYDVRLITYVDADITPENVLIVGIRKDLPS